ncbi:orotidine-5'-phosphate decarboxylase [Bacillus sp. FJAT-29790]|uniref:orotidine-5'-phosphate decarboxylase n=1 Tax=Bacillus sp. FJAT-29790 TaxID=1895002 RepID=UPI001C247E81|nr:orotidine-5'-phosphate decarboxylase [Bacillus sp. FJAT-29790]
MKNSLIIALDFAGKDEVIKFLDQFNDEKLFLKVGMELFYQEGPKIIYEIKERGHDIFLDLKLHDIPNTVKSAMKGLARLECDLVNVHAAGGKEMMAAALEGLEAGTSSGRTRPACIAVTQLTSTSEEQMKLEQLINAPLKDSVLHYASLANAAGLDGVVCSSYEAREICDLLGDSFLTVAPGIRMKSDDVQDQKRVATPEFAKSEGVSAIVVGRSITRSENPAEQYDKFLQSWGGLHQ